MTLKKTINHKKESKRRKEKENDKNNQKASDKTAISTYQLIITLNVNDLNAPFKKQRVTEWLRK